jgi:uncharacterized membrane protein YidH (DUF202 family)
MKYLVYTLQLVISVIGFLFFSFLAGIVGSYAIEYKQNPTIIDRTIYAFNSSSYPYIACGFMVWTLIVIVLMLLKKKRKNSEEF